MLWVPTVLADVFLYLIEATTNQEKRKEAMPILSFNVLLYKLGPLRQFGESLKEPQALKYYIN
jgi:hypothetical protein